MAVEHVHICNAGSVIDLFKYESLHDRSEAERIEPRLWLHGMSIGEPNLRFFVTKRIMVW
jgi:hypothetical protein